MRVRGKVRGRGAGESGSALVTGLITVVMLLGMSAAVMTITLEKSDERSEAVDSQRALNVANAGIAHALTNISAANTDDIASEEAPFAFSDGGYWVTVADQGTDTYLVTSVGQVRGDREVVQAVVQGEQGGVFDNAIFAGNSSGDPLYTLGLGGSGGQNDQIFGDMYVGGNLTLVDDASVTGTVRAAGVITGMDGVEGAGQLGPNLYAMNYPGTADVQVADEFNGGDAEYKSDGAGGTAWQLPEENPAHIFRKNPSDRKTEYQSTVKDDFFMEDPYESVSGGSQTSSKYAYQVSLSGVNGESGANSNKMIYYVDGNLWLHNKHTYSLQMESASGDGTQVLFVVSGNIYFSDNFFYGDEDNDGVAFIAMQDDDYPDDTGNIYFGDPVFGTINKMYGYMYAENNFYDMNLDSSGSEKVEIHGNMSAGNQVIVDRDYKTAYGSIKHTKLTVDFDERVSNGALNIPGLPGQSGAGEASNFSVVAWRRVGETQLAQGENRGYEDYEAPEEDPIHEPDTTGVQEQVAETVDEVVDDVVDDVVATAGGSNDTEATETSEESEETTETWGNDWGNWSNWKKKKKKWGSWW